MRPIDADRMVDAAFKSVTKAMLLNDNAPLGDLMAKAMYQAVVAAAQDTPTLTEDEWNELRAANESVDGN